MHRDHDACHRALAARDRRFDGVFYVGVQTTGVYCRPVCPARTPRPANCSFFPSAAAAERDGYRPCRRCRPELAPGLAPSDGPERLAIAAITAIEGGALDGDGSLESLAARLGASPRHLRRAVHEWCGATPTELAQTRRLLLAKHLLTETDLPVSDVALASGFRSTRRLQTSFRERYDMAPTSLRGGRRGRRSTARTKATDTDDAMPAVTLQLAYRPPLAWAPLVGFLADDAPAGVEAVIGDDPERATLVSAAHVDDVSGWFTATPDPERSVVRLGVSEALVPVIGALIPRVRGLLDLDADPARINAHLEGDPRLAASIELEPGRRVPGALDGFEMIVRAILGQQVSVKAAQTFLSKLATGLGTPLPSAGPGGVERRLPGPAVIAAASDDALRAVGITRPRVRALRAVAERWLDGRLRVEPGLERVEVERELCDVPGIGPWTASYVAMRAARAPDAFPASDLVLLQRSGHETPRALETTADAWRPWRAYAAMHVWDGPTFAELER